MRVRPLVQFALSASDVASGEFAGIASVFGSLVDTWPPTRILPGAFAQTLTEDLDRVRVLWQHDTREVIGFPLECREIEEGLYVRAHVSPTSRGRDVLTLMRDFADQGKRLDLSIGFAPVEWSMTQEDGREAVRLISQLRLWEVSLVTWGADPLATVVSVQGVAHPGLAGLASGPITEDTLGWLASLMTWARARHDGRALSAPTQRLVEEAMRACQALLPPAENPAGPEPTTPAVRAHTTRALALLELEARTARVWV